MLRRQRSSSVVAIQVNTGRDTLAPIVTVLSAARRKGNPPQIVTIERTIAVIAVSAKNVRTAITIFLLVGILLVLTEI